MTRWDKIARRQEKAAALASLQEKRQAVRAYVREATRCAERRDWARYSWSVAVLRDHWKAYRTVMHVVYG